MRPIALSVVLILLMPPAAHADYACTCKVDPKPPSPLPACVKPRPQDHKIQSRQDCEKACPDGTLAIWGDKVDREFACARGPT